MFGLHKMFNLHNMFTLHQRKKHTNFLVKNTQQSLYKITGNDKISGFVVVIIHWLIIGLPLIYILFGKVNIFYYILSSLVYVIYCLQIYFNGCILARIERHLFKTTEWWGPWIILFKPLEYIGIYMDTNRANKIINCGIFFLSIIIIYKLSSI
jgi:hypothetical protein